MMNQEYLFSSASYFFGEPELKQSTCCQHEAADEPEVGPYDIICGRHREAFNNVGNRRFRVTVALYLDRYNEAPTRADKSRVIVDVIEFVRDNGGRFLKSRGGQWYDLDEKHTREKVGHALRDMTVAKDQSGPQAKAMLRANKEKGCTCEPQPVCINTPLPRLSYLLCDCMNESDVSYEDVVNDSKKNLFAELLASQLDLDDDEMHNCACGCE